MAAQIGAAISVSFIDKRLEGPISVNFETGDFNGMNDTDKAATVGLTTDIVSAFVANNAIGAAALPELISMVHSALQNLGAPAPTPEPEKQLPAISIKKSLTDDYIISLEDGKPYKSLKRHLSGRGLTPDGYRQKWGLPSTYPMVAPAYAKQRSDLARSMGLGRKRAEIIEEPVPAKRGRPKKV